MSMSLTDGLALLALVAAIVAAYFAYPAWRESRRKARLRLSIHAERESDLAQTEVVANAGQNQVVFGLTLHNDGNRNARYWRLSVVSPNQPQNTMVFLGGGPDRTGRIFRDPRFSEGRWIAEALTENPADRVLPRVPLRLGDRFTLNFQGQPPQIEAEYRFDAEGAEPVSGVLMFDFDWQVRRVNLSASKLEASMTESDNRDTRAREDQMARDRARYQWMLDSVSKFRLFFAGLVFAMLSFSVQFAVATTNRAAKGCQLAAWILLLLTGMLSLRDAGGFVTKNTQDVFEGLSPTMRRRMWACFVLAIILLMSARFLADWAM